eukprot:6188902-Pleurochrysis_carterae.AAC.1
MSGSICHNLRSLCASGPSACFAGLGRSLRCHAATRSCAPQFRSSCEPPPVPPYRKALMNDMRAALSSLSLTFPRSSSSCRHIYHLSTKARGSSPRRHSRPAPPTPRPAAPSALAATGAGTAKQAQLPGPQPLSLGAVHARVPAQLPVLPPAAPSPLPVVPPAAQPTMLEALPLRPGAAAEAGAAEPATSAQTAASIGPRQSKHLQASLGLHSNSRRQSTCRLCPQGRPYTAPAVDCPSMQMEPSSSLADPCASGFDSDCGASPPAAAANEACPGSATGRETAPPALRP